MEVALGGGCQQSGNTTTVSCSKSFQFSPRNKETDLAKKQLPVLDVLDLDSLAALGDAQDELVNPVDLAKEDLAS